MRILFSLCALLLVTGFYSCDKVSNPIINKGGAVVPTQPPTHVDSTSATDDAMIKVLLEDYTAQLCTNCPATSAQFETLLNSAKGKQAVFMECNVGSFAQSQVPGTTHGLPSSDSAYYADFINLADSEWDNVFINTSTNGWPGTMADRIYYNGTAGSSDLSLNTINFNTPYDSLIATAQTAKIHIVDSMYIPPTSTVSMSITTTLLSPQPGNKYYLVVALVEDSIFDWQDSVGNDVRYYLKRMTMRTAINDGGHGFGDSLSNTTAPQTMHYAYQSDKFRYNSTIAVPPVVPPRYWNMAHMYVVAFVYQRTSGKNDYFVLQAQELHI